MQGEGGKIASETNLRTARVYFVLVLLLLLVFFEGAAGSWKETFLGVAFCLWWE